MKSVALIAALASSLCAGCVPRFIDVPPEPTKTVWVERQGELRHSVAGDSSAREVVRIDTKDVKSLSASERVVWIEGIDIQNSKFQRTHQRGSDIWSSVMPSAKFGGTNLVDVFKFPVVSGELSVEAQLQIEKFKPVSGARYYVEFLNRAAMTEESVDTMLSVWKSLSSRLKLSGMNMSNVVMGGNKYGQDVDAIVIVKVGK